MFSLTLVVLVIAVLCRDIAAIPPKVIPELAAALSPNSISNSSLQCSFCWESLVGNGSSSNSTRCTKMSLRVESSGDKLKEVLKNICADVATREICQQKLSPFRFDMVQLKCRAARPQDDPNVVKTSETIIRNYFLQESRLPNEKKAEAKRQVENFEDQYKTRTVRSKRFIRGQSFADALIGFILLSLAVGGIWFFVSKVMSKTKAPAAAAPAASMSKTSYPGSVATTVKA